MDLSTRLQIPEHVLYRNLDGDESVLLNLETGTYFALDSVGTRVWELLAMENDLHQICVLLEQEFEADFDRIRRDLLDLAEELLRQGLVEPAERED